MYMKQMTYPACYTLDVQQKVSPILYLFARYYWPMTSIWWHSLFPLASNCWNKQLYQNVSALLVETAVWIPSKMVTGLSMQIMIHMWRFTKDFVTQHSKSFFMTCTSKKASCPPSSSNFELDIEVDTTDVWQKVIDLLFAVVPNNKCINHIKNQHELSLERMGALSVQSYLWKNWQQPG